MAKPFDMIPITKLWVTITNNSLLCQRLSEYMKLANNSNWSYVWFNGRWRYFFHSCIHERWIVQLVGVAFWYDCSHVCTRVFYPREFLFIMKPLLVGKNIKCELVLPFQNGCWVLISLLCFSDFVFTIWASIVTCCVQTSS
jgi:hypothetical protein